MIFEDAVKKCHIRSAIMRTGDPTKIFTEEDLNKLHQAVRDLKKYKVGTIVNKLYWKNHTEPLEKRVSESDKRCDDWIEYDPREQEDCSQYNEMPS